MTIRPNCETLRFASASLANAPFILDGIRRRQGRDRVGPQGSLVLLEAPRTYADDMANLRADSCPCDAEPREGRGVMPTVTIEMLCLSS